MLEIVPYIAQTVHGIRNIFADIITSNAEEYDYDLLFDGPADKILNITRNPSSRDSHIIIRDPRGS